MNKQVKLSDIKGLSFIGGQITSRIEAFKSEMDSFSEELYDSLIENMSLTVEDFIHNMEANRDNIEREIGSTLKKLEL